MSLHPPAPAGPARFGPPPAQARQLPQYTQPGYERRPTNVVAFFSLLTAASAWFLTGPLGSIAGLVLGFIALAQLKKREQDGKGLAMTAIVFSALSMVVGTILVVVIVQSLSNFTI